MKYNPSVHAVERIREYFDVQEDGAKRFINEAMRKSKYVTTQADGKLVYKNAEHDAMIVVNATSNTVVTVLPPKGRGKSNAYTLQETRFNGAITATIRREMAKARRAYVRETRRLSEEIAIIGLEIAQLTLNKARAKSPVTQRHISAKVADIHAEQERLAAIRKQADTEYKALRAEAAALIGQEVAQ